MSLLEFSGLRFSYSDEIVIDEASGALHSGNITGLIGPNGGGKSTLLRILTGQLAPERGSVQQNRSASMAAVWQAAAGEDEDRLLEYVRRGRGDLLELEQTIERLHAQLAAAPEDEEAVRRLAAAEESYSLKGGHHLDTEVERLLGGLSFTEEQYSAKLGQLSGGQRQKAALAHALISNASLLIFDEPTNHLDLEAQAFFASCLRSLPRESAVLLVSHDRWLLDELCSAIWEMEDGILHRYKGNYSASMAQREQRREQWRLAFERQQEHIAKTEEFIRRNIAGQNTKQARGRRKHLARMERVGKPGEDPSMRFVLTPALQSGEDVLNVEQLGFSYQRAVIEGGELELPAAEKPAVSLSPGPRWDELNPPIDHARPAVSGSERMVVEDVNFQIFRGERLGIVGPNGCGKTTLLRLISRGLKPQRGAIIWGRGVELGVFSQDSADLSPGRDLISELRSVEAMISDSDARQYLARFGFSGDDAFQDVGGLSGGERSRLSLAKIFRRRPNVLLFDEPTNHLDIYAREALEAFLLAYEGTLILVTHDRALLSRVANRLVVFERGAEGVASMYFNGGYEDYVKWRSARQALGSSAASSSARHSEAAQNPYAELEEAARAARTSVAGYVGKLIEKAQRVSDEVEARIEAAEAEVEALRQQQHSADQRGNTHELMRLQEAIEAASPALENLYGEFSRAHDEVERLESLLTSYESSAQQ